MFKQRGQALVEFAVIVPLFFTMFFAALYGGILFMDYLQFNNAARGVARAIAISDSDTRTKLADDFKNKEGFYFKQLTGLYSPVPSVEFINDNQDVQVTIDLTLNNDKVPGLLTKLNFPPKNLKLIQVVMPIEIKT